MRASVVVPVYNPGPNLRFCLDSLTAQTLPRADFEVVLVDDGSTDGTAERLDELQSSDPEFYRVVHIPNSGWPGRPRNVGVESARGGYVQFVDNDDELAPDALERLVALGEESDADVVIGKMASDFRGLNHSVFRDTIRGRTLADFPFEETLTPHKMFRHAFLREHDIRFPEGPRHLEDQLFVMRSYVHARSISLAGARPCYFYRRRRGVGRNAGDVYMEPREYYANLAEVLDVVTTSILDQDVRNRVLRRFYRVEVLGRLSGPAMATYDEDYRRRLATEARAQATRWLTTEMAAGLPTLSRLQLRLLLADDVDGLVRLAAAADRVGLTATVAQPHWDNGALRLDVEAILSYDGEPMRLDRDGDRHLLPAAMTSDAPDADRVLDPPQLADVELALASRATSGTYPVAAELRVAITDEPGGGVVRITGVALLDPQRADAGAPLSVGLWDLRLRLRYAGWSRTAALQPPAGARALAPAVGGGVAIIPYWTRPRPSLALDVGEWAHALPAELVRDARPTARRATLAFAVPAVVIDGATYPLALLLVPATNGPGLATCPAELARDGDRAVVRAHLPVRRLAGHDWHVWLRAAQPGNGPAQQLDVAVRVTRRGRVTLLN